MPAEKKANELPRIDHDRLFKQLVQTFLAEFVELFLPELHKQMAGPPVFLNKEIYSGLAQGDRHELDLLAKCPLAGTNGHILIHFENQAQALRLDGRRMFNYFAFIHQNHAEPIFPIVVFSHDSTLPEPNEYIMELPGLRVLEFHYHVIQLRRRSWKEFLGIHNPVACALMAKTAMKPEERVTVKIECLRMLVSLKLDRAKQYFISGFVDTYLRLNRAEELRFNQETSKLVEAEERKAIMELTTSWKEEGRQEGRQEGLLKGRLQVISRLLQRRCGEISAATMLKLQDLTSEQLDKLTDAVMDLNSVEDLETWLYRN